MPREEAEFEELLAMYCAPVLKNIKIANMFHVSNKQFDDVKDLVQRYQNKLKQCGVQFYLFQEGCKRLTIYVYRKHALLHRLHHSKVHSFLSDFGYPDQEDLSAIFKHLNHRLCESCSYPHEIGVFLGYPLEDVEGFMKQESCKLVGYWKVYGNLEDTLKTFEAYDQARDYVIGMTGNGNEIRDILAAS